MNFPSACKAQGFDVCHSFHTGWYNDQIEREGLVKSGQLELLPVSSRAFLVGNTKAIWPLFSDWLVQQFHECYDHEDDGDDQATRQQRAIEKLLQTKDLFDTFCDGKLMRILQEQQSQLPSSQQYEIFWAHGGRESCCGDITKTDAEQPNSNASFLVSMQRVAYISGLCWHDEEGTKMCVHPLYGTWKAFRAVILFHPKGDTGCSTLSSTPPLPRQLPCPAPPEEIERAKVQMQVAIQLSAADGTGVDYGAGKMDETGKSLCRYLHHSVCDGTDWSLVSPSMRAWIDLRDCISLGREDFRYSDPQLLYHYTKDPGVLRNILLQGSSAK